MAWDALYGRQSIEKKDSISVESQLEYCRYETHGEPYIEYTDRGFSGKDVNRPGFEQMMADIAEGKIKRVIVYKLDRISRSILDFANMMEVFREHHVEFVSSTEKFDTSTPIGRAMLNICIVFAQLERETIQKRVTDAYYARCRHGFYMGGRIPYGYRLKKTVIDQVQTSMYEEVEDESRQLKLIFSMYADHSCSLGDIVRYLDAHHIQHLRGGHWSTARISEILRNPIYVRADIDVYSFFQDQGAKIHNAISDFIGKNGCYLYKGTDTGATRRGSLAGREVVLAPHDGFITSKTWLTCRKRCLDNRQSAKDRKVKNSWLTGKIKCGNCGHALTVRRSKTKWGRYFICSGPGSVCGGSGCTVYADVLEDHMLRAVGAELSGFSALCPKIEKTASEKDEKQKMRLAQIEEEINGLLLKVADADDVLMRYINKKIAELDVEKCGLLGGALTKGVSSLVGERREILDHPQMWNSISFEDRRAVVDILVEAIYIANGKMEIMWRI